MWENHQLYDWYNNIPWYYLTFGIKLPAARITSSLYFLSELCHPKCWDYHNPVWSSLVDKVLKPTQWSNLCNGWPLIHDEWFLTWCMVSQWCTRCRRRPELKLVVDYEWGKPHGSHLIDTSNAQMMAMICDVISKVGLTPIDRRSHLAMMKLGRFALWASARWGHLFGDSSARHFFPQSLHSYCGFCTHLRLVRWNIASDMRWLFLLVVLDQCGKNHGVELFDCSGDRGVLAESLQAPGRFLLWYFAEGLCNRATCVCLSHTHSEVFWKPWHAVAVLNHGKTTGPPTCSAWYS